jgi:hypothetical protein
MFHRVFFGMRSSRRLAPAIEVRVGSALGGRGTRASVILVVSGVGERLVSELAKETDTH